MEYSKELALELQERYNISPSYVEEWEKDSKIPSFFSSDAVIEKSDVRIKYILKVHSNYAINSSKLAHKKALIWNLKQPIQKRVSEIEIELESLRIEQLKKDLFSFLSLDVSVTDTYKSKMEKILFDNRIMYSNVTPIKSYGTYRKRWKNNTSNIDITMLNIEKDALQKLYNTLFPTQKRYYAVSINVDFQGGQIELKTPATSKEEAFKELKKMPFGREADFTIENIYETEFIYNRNEKVESTFDYLPEVEDPSYIETDPDKFV